MYLITKFILKKKIKSISTRVHKILSSRKIKLGAVESLTGGLIADCLISNSGSSAYFDSGCITYSNRAKTAIAGVPHSVLQIHGAVAAETARDMCQAYAGRYQLDAVIAATGIAGPGGGTANKPVGTVYIAVYYKNKTEVQYNLFSGKRQVVRLKAVYQALCLLIKIINMETADKGNFNIPLQPRQPC
ncbi:MAG TPA: CinA family protein [Spirochaetota bacterium]|nr:CinA family protein [Spirochaetota bacterium]